METWEQHAARLAVSPRLRALETRLVSLADAPDADADGVVRAIGLLMLDAILENDTYTLDAALPGLRGVSQQRRVHAETPASWVIVGRIESLVQQVLFALERLSSLSDLADFAEDSQSARFLGAVAETPGLDSSAVGERISANDQRVSVVGRQLLQRGMVRQRRAGRHRLWEITPRGTQTLQQVRSGGAHRPRREHRSPVS